MSAAPRRGASRSLLSGHAPKQRLSQSFLVDLEARDAIVAAGGATQGETVLEIGPGLGVLTEGLLGAGARVVAIEIDDDLLPRLQEKFASEIARGDLTLIHGDALNVELEPLLPSQGVWRVVANIPYHITSPLLHRLLLLEHPAERIVLLVQREVAERVAAPVGDWSYLTAFVRSRCEARIVRHVRRESFEPVPAVDSAVLSLDRLPASPLAGLSDDDEEQLWRLVQAGFRERRKKLRNALPRALPIPADQIMQALDRAEADPDLRAQALSVEDWVRLLRELGDIPGAPTRPPRVMRTLPGEAPARRGRVGAGRVHWIEVDAPGKVNLTLAVVGRRDDGYHDLHSIVAPLRVSDHLTLRLLGGEGTEDELHCAGIPISGEGENLIRTAIRELRRELPIPPLDIVLEKRLPVAAGLGGGSSDAAAALRGALDLCAVELTEERLMQVAARVGSDVPLFIPGGPVLMEGRGERITPLAPWGEPAPGVLLISAREGIRTPDVFAAFAAGVRGDAYGAALVSSQHLASEALAGLSTVALLQRSAALASANDLLAAARAITPWLRPLDHALRRLLGRPLSLSGSGPTLFLLYPSLYEAAEAGALVEAAISRGELALPDGGVLVTATEFAS
ncbi:MAG: 16S rRNA (adenine(1518)-N(6)/adenine(1519)-N(6))-dimethyltransferase RsmA [Candidatus Limnocylindrus sp.]